MASGTEVAHTKSKKAFDELILAKVMTAASYVRCQSVVGNYCFMIDFQLRRGLQCGTLSAEGVNLIKTVSLKIKLKSFQMRASNRSRRLVTEFLCVESSFLKFCVLS